MFPVVATRRMSPLPAMAAPDVIGALTPIVVAVMSTPTPPPELPPVMPLPPIASSLMSVKATERFPLSTVSQSTSFAALVRVMAPAVFVTASRNALIPVPGVCVTGPPAKSEITLPVRAPTTRPSVSESVRSPAETVPETDPTVVVSRESLLDAIVRLVAVTDVWSPALVAVIAPLTALSDTSPRRFTIRPADWKSMPPVFAVTVTVLAVPPACTRSVMMTPSPEILMLPSAVLAPATVSVPAVGPISMSPLPVRFGDTVL